MALSLQRAQLFAASAQLAFGPLNRDSGAGARAGWVLEDPDGYCTKEHCRDWKNPGSETIPAGTMQKKFLPSVDASGAAKNRHDQSDYGRGGGHTIDTSKPFEVHTNVDNAGAWSVELRQGTKKAAAADRKEGAARSHARCAPREGGTATSRCKCVSYQVSLSQIL